MKRVSNCVGSCCLLAIVVCTMTFPSWAQTTAINAPQAKISTIQGSAGAPRPPQGFQQYIVSGKLQLSLVDAIRLALVNNTDVQIDLTQVDSAKISIGSALGRFDPLLNADFNTQRASSPSSTQLAGAPVAKSLTQLYQLGFTQTFQTGTSVQASVSANRLSSNSSFNTINPSVAGNFSVAFAQPLLRGRGLLPNRGPILIAQRNLEESRATFRQEVSTVMLNVVSQYWNVVQARQILVVQQKSLDEAQESYDHDKQSLEKGALPPLDIYRSESQVASRRVSEIQAEYAVKETEDTFRRVIGADIDPNLRALDIDLTEHPEPVGDLMTMDIPAALEKALAARAEVEALRLQLSSDGVSVEIAKNGLEPNLSLTGSYQSNGLNNTNNGPVLEALGQTFGFGFPSYGFGLSLSLPIKNHAAEANLGGAEVSKRRDLYAQRQLQQQITLDVTSAVHQLEESKLSLEAAKISLDLAQKNLQAEERKYELGSETLFVVLQTQTELAQAEQSLLQADIDYQLAVASVEFATGTLLDHFGVQIAK